MGNLGLYTFIYAFAAFIMSSSSKSSKSPIKTFFCNKDIRLVLTNRCYKCINIFAAPKNNALYWKSNKSCPLLYIDYVKGFLVIQQYNGINSTEILIFLPSNISYAYPICSPRFAECSFALLKLPIICLLIGRIFTPITISIQLHL